MTSEELNELIDGVADAAESCLREIDACIHGPADGDAGMMLRRFLLSKWIGETADLAVAVSGKAVVPLDNRSLYSRVLYARGLAYDLAIEHGDSQVPEVPETGLDAIAGWLGVERATYWDAGETLAELLVTLERLCLNLARAFAETRPG